jgi:hypothetical protein
MRRAASLLLCVLGLACNGGGEGSRPTLLDDPLADFPLALSEVGLYPDLREPERASERAIAYEPRYPLWSNGSQKQRFVVLPEGTIVDTSVQPWSWPDGSLLFKTFAFQDEEAPGGLRYAETRLLRKSAERWEYAAYAWREDRSDAELLDGVRATELDAIGPEGERFVHEVPSRRQCRTCHESARSAVLGFDALQLGGQELERLLDARILDDLPEPEEISAERDETAWVLGYVTGNCVHCHNDYPEGENSSFDLRHGVFLESTVNRETESSASGDGIRIQPGQPEESVLFLAFTGQDNGTGIKDMPPLGVQLRDAQAADRLGSFIEELEDSSQERESPSEDP